jgi:hypothetical protein
MCFFLHYYKEKQVFKLNSSLDKIAKQKGDQNGLFIEAHPYSSVKQAAWLVT